MTIFTKIIKREIPADIIYETEKVLAFKDIDPKAPVHVLIIPKQEIEKITDIDGKKDAPLLGEMFDAANQIAKQMNMDENGFRLVINCGSDGGQAVSHLHMHLLGGRQMKWPPG